MLCVIDMVVSISIGDSFDWVANSVGPVINNGHLSRLPDEP